MLKSFTNYIYYLSPKLFRLLLGPILLFLTVKILSIEDFGRYSYWLAFFSLIYPISNLGIKDYLIKRFSRAQAKGQYLNYLSSIMQLNLIYLLISFFIFINIDNELDIYIKIILIFSLLGNSAIIGQAILEANNESYLNAKVLTFTLFLSFFIRLFFLLTKNPTLFILSHAFEPLIFFGLMQKYNPHFNFRLKEAFKFSRKYFIHFSKISFPLILSTLMVNIYMRADQLMIANILDYSELGKFSIAVRLVELSYIFGIAYTAATFPKLSSLYIEKSKKIYYFEYKKKLSLLAFFSVIICLLYLFSSNFLISLMTKESINEIEAVLNIYCLACFSVYLGSILTKHLILTQRYKYILITASLGGFSNIILNLFMIPKFGILGAAYGTLLSMGVTIILPGFFLFRDIKRWL